MDKVVSTIEQNEQADPDFYADPNPLSGAGAGFFFNPAKETAADILDTFRTVHSNVLLTRRFTNHSNIRYG